MNENICDGGSFLAGVHNSDEGHTRRLSQLDVTINRVVSLSLIAIHWNTEIRQRIDAANKCLDTRLLRWVPSPVELKVDGRR